MRTKIFRFHRVPLFTFELDVMRPIGGTGPQADQRQAWEAIRLRLSLLNQPNPQPYAHFWLGLEPDESAPTTTGWMNLADCLLNRIGVADALWWAFLHDGANGLPHMHITAYLVDSSGQPLGTRLLRLGRPNVDGTIRIGTPGSRVPEKHNSEP